MLDLAEVNFLLSRITYMDGYHLFAKRDPFEGIYVRIVVHTDDASTGEPTVLGINTYLSPNDLQGVDTMLTWLQWRLQRIASHEVREFLRIDGELFSDPHKEEVDA
jgi:hypothetical protein